MHNRLSDIFENEPRSWGLRGDPFLWREMKEILSEQAYPAAETDFWILIEETFKKLTGKSLKEKEFIYVEKYSHVGMSSGLVSPEFWRETGIPELLRRYRETK